MILRTLRSFDGIAFSACVLLILLVHPSAARDPLGRYTIVVALPVIAILWFVLRIPRALHDTSDWHRQHAQLTLSALVFAGLSPFIAWWSLVPANVYLFVNCLIAVAAGILFLYNLVNTIRHLAIAYDDDALAATAFLYKYSVLCLLFCTYSAICLHVTIQIFMFDQLPQIALRNLTAIPAYQTAVYTVLIIWGILLAMTGVVLPFRIGRTLNRVLLTPDPPSLPVEPPESCPPSS